MKKLALFLSLIVYVLVAYSGKPLSGTSVYVEDIKSGETIAFQQTNKQGHVSFTKLGKGIYNLIVTLPKQKGKYEPKQKNNKRSHKIAYHVGKKLYYLQEPGGYFTVKYSGINNILNSNVTPVYQLKQIKNNQDKHVIGKFEVKRKKGAITLEMDVFTESEFQKQLEKVKNDPDLILISGTKSYSTDNKKIVYRVF